MMEDIKKFLYDIVTSKLFMGVSTFVVLSLVMVIASGVIVRDGNVDCNMSEEGA